MGGVVVVDSAKGILVQSSISNPEASSSPVASVTDSNAGGTSSFPSRMRSSSRTSLS